MCFVSKKIKEKALSRSQGDLRAEYDNLQEELKYYAFTGQKKKIKSEKSKLKALRKAIIFQHTRKYVKKIGGMK